ncbi:MAG: glycosyltransferase WbuB [Acidobacteriaceae bacterium]|nr:glycosyltransferase WbuB [Acidobacteriaceae bacterium]
MRILLLNQFFWPDSSATSQMLTDLARHLVSEGHDVEVICADGNYAVADAGHGPAAKVNRVRGVPFGRGKIGRVLSYLSFYLLALVRCFSVKKPDLVVTLTTPPLLSLLGTLLQSIRGSRHFIWEMDVYPNVAVSLEYFKASGLADQITGALADFSRRRSNGIIALGECMKDLLITRGIDGSKIYVADNWADGRAITPKIRTFNAKDLVLLYSGNLGLAHDLDTITGAISNLREDKRFRFEFVGSGGRRKDLEAFCSVQRLNTVFLRSYTQRSKLGDSLGEGDIGLVTQIDSCCGAVVPSKVYGLLAAGRPVLFIGPKQATPARIIEQYGCGWQVDCGDVDGLTKLLLRLIENRHEIEIAAALARETLLDNYDLPIGVARISKILGVSRGKVRPSALVSTTYAR